MAVMIQIIMLIILILLLLLLRIIYVKMRDQSVFNSFEIIFENIDIGIFWSDVREGGTFIRVNPALVKLLGYESSNDLKGILCADMYASPSERSVLIDELIQNGFVKNREVLLKKKNGASICCLFTAIAQYDKKGIIKYVGGALEDMTERKRAEEALKEGEERLRTLYRYSPVPTTTWQKKGDDFQFIDYNIAQEEFTNQKANTVLGKMAKDIYFDQPYFTQDMFRCFVEKTVLKREMPYRVVTTGINKYIIVTFAYVPPDLVILQFDDITARKKAEEELRSLSSRLMSLEEKERKRITRELHDSIGQYLTAIKFKLDNINEFLQHNNVDSAIESISSAIPIVQQTVQEVRRIIMDLRPTILDDLGIIATLNWFCREFQSVYADIRVEQVIMVEEHEIPEHLKIIIYRVLQETMHNAAKYSKSHLIRIKLKAVRNKIELSIMDNGTGFDIKHVHRGLGLISMRERVESSKGKLSIRSWKWIGTMIHASWSFK